VIKLDIEEWEGHPPYEVVHHPGAAAVLAIRPDQQVILVKQFRPPVRDVLTEIPAGILDVDGEDALTCASRELLEETGYRHDTIEFLGGYYSSAGFTDEYVHLFWARARAEPVGPPEEGIEVMLMPFERMVAAARAGRIRDAKTALALLLASGRPPLP
jgi:ADP-ribose pyrophosphatase